MRTDCPCPAEVLPLEHPCCAKIAQVEKYFVSAGFAFVHADSTAEVCAVEAVKLDDLDPEAVRAGLAEYNAKLGSLQVPSC